MDKAVFIKELREIFHNLNKQEKRYSKVWLSDENFGGLYYSGLYKLHLKAEHKIERYRTEARFLIDLLNEKLGEAKNTYIFNMKIYDENEEAYPDRGDIILYTDEAAYLAA